MNFEQLYQKNIAAPFNNLSDYEGLYNVNTTRKWCIRKDFLYYVTKEFTGLCHLWCVDLKNGGTKKEVLSFVSSRMGDDFSVLYAMNSIFIYRLFADGIEIFRWKNTADVLSPLPSKFIKTTSRIEGFDLNEIFCSERGNESYNIFAINIDSGKRREVYRNSHKDLRNILVLNNHLVIYDYIYDNDSVSCPLGDYDIHLIDKQTGHAFYSFDAFRHIVDADNGFIWSIKEQCGNQYLVPLNLRYIAAGEIGERQIDLNTSVMKLPEHTVYGSLSDFTFNGITLFNLKNNTLTIYNRREQKGKVLEKGPSLNFGKSGKYFYIKKGEFTYLYLQENLDFKFKGTVEEIIGK